MNLDNIVKRIPVVLFALMSIAIGYLLYERNSSSLADQEFRSRLDSIERVNESLMMINVMDSLVINYMKNQDSILLAAFDKQKGKVIIINNWIDSSKKAVDSLPPNQLAHQLNKRYGVDTISNPIPIARPVLVSTVKDLVELDGSKAKLVVMDSMLALQTSRLLYKDSTINLLEARIDRDRVIIGNKDLIITEWKGQYDLISVENKQLKSQTKFNKVLNYILGAGLVFVAVSK